MTDPLPPSPRRGLCLVLAAPSGAGKTSLSRALLAAEPALRLSISATTRAPRSGEREGVDYYFRSAAKFAALRARGELLEWAEVFGHHYGTPRAPVMEALGGGTDVLFDIDWQGFRQLRAALPGDVVGVFLLPPSLEELTRRLEGRGDPPGLIAQRMARARDEIAHCQEFDYVVMNTVFEAALAALRHILAAERLRRTRQGWLPSYLAALGLSLPPARAEEERG
jgi:guanylate kinase